MIRVCTINDKENIWKSIYMEEPYAGANFGGDRGVWI